MIGEIFLRDVSLSSCVWQSTIFIVVGLVGSFILRNRSSRAHQVLFLAMIAAVIVPIMSILVKYYELGVFVAKPVIIQSPVKDLTTTSYYTNSTVFSTEDIEYKPGPIEENLPPVVSSSESIKLPWRSILLYGWIAASLLLAARLLVTFVLGVRILGQALPLHCERIEQALHLARAKLGIDKDVSIRSSQGVRSPVIWCWRRRPVLLVPSAAAAFDNGIDWAGVLCHELAHWKRRDYISGLLTELVVCILPWHPLLWWAKSRLVKLSEQACDDWVLATGQPCTDYAESLLDLTPGGQMAFVPAVVSSKRGLADRIRRILKDKCGNPRTGATWALAVSIMAASLAVGIAFAQSRPVKAETGIQRRNTLTKSLHEAAADVASFSDSGPAAATTNFLHFPKDQSVGVVYVQDEDLFVPETVKGFHSGYTYAERENFCPARGEVRVPAGKRVILTIRGVGATPERRRAALKSLGPDDLYGLEFFFLSPTRIDDDLMALIARLKGLKILSLDGVQVTPRSLALVVQLPQLEHLFTPKGISDAGMAEIAKIQSLKDLNVFHDRMTNEGLRSLGKLASLEVLNLYGNPKMTDDGLRALTQLRSLKHLRLGKEGLFTDRGMAHLAAMPSLKVLWLDTPNVTDEGLRRLAQSRSLERLCICWLDKITDRGIAYLKAMPQLKGLNAMHLKLLTNATMAHLATMPNIEDLRLPHGFTDAGINHLAKLDRMKYLWVNCAGNSPLTDKSLVTISNLHRLEELHISGTGFTNDGIELLQNLENLSTLHIAFWSGLDNETLKLLAGLPKLRDLSWFSSDNVTMSGLSALNNLAGLEGLSVYDIHQDNGGLDLSGLKKLSRLRIMMRHHTTRVGNEFVTTWDAYHDSDLTSLSGLTNLEDLSLTGPGIGDAGLKYLAALTNLKYLQIGGSANLTADGLKNLADMRRLDSLFIGDSRITERGLAHLYPLKTLHIIRITSAIPVSGKAIARLRTELPHLQILDISQPKPPPRRPRTSKPRARP